MYNYMYYSVLYFHLNYNNSYVLLVQRIGELFRKLWNPRHFRAHVSPHEMLQAVSSVSNKKFKITEQGMIMMYMYVLYMYITVGKSVHIHNDLKLKMCCLYYIRTCMYYSV